MILREVPAELIRPKPPTSGKKILLEYLPFWDRISFLNKVMLRNIFRYRQRLLMMLVGIGGCTALLLTGFGVRDSIGDIVDFQYRDVTHYDMEIRFEEGLDHQAMLDFTTATDRYVDSVIFAYQCNAELEFNGYSRDIIMICAEDNLSQFMDFHQGSHPITMPGRGEALLSVGMAEKMDVSVGDRINLRDPDLNEVEVTISGIYDNYVYNYIVLSPQTIADAWGEYPACQMAYLTVKAGQDVHVAGSKVSDQDGVMNVTICADVAEQVGSMLEALNLVVVTVVICAGLLAVTVLYNLTNINITERLREIATIKVLGFHATESAAYVFKENLLLSIMGSLAGLAGGYWLLTFVMSQIKVDVVWMPARLLPSSYGWAVALTMLSALIVDFVLYFKLDKINMAEALKSVE
jgi:putative ABC transport system permease protein